MTEVAKLFEHGFEDVPIVQVVPKKPLALCIVLFLQVDEFKLN